LFLIFMIFNSSVPYIFRLFPIKQQIAAFLFYMAINVDDWLPESGKPNLKMITTVIFALNFLSATQDVAVDGWSLTMLKK